MRTQENRAAETARIISDSRSLYTRTDGEPFFFSSGWASPVFIDCKKLISSPDDRALLVEMAVEAITAHIDPDSLDAIAGCELTGVPFAALIADRLHKPLVLVCKQRKGFGRLAQFEGSFEAGAKVLLIDDLATDGASESVFMSALRKAEAEILGTFVLVDFNVFTGEHRMLSLATLEDIMDRAESDGYFGRREADEVRKFIRDAPTWSRKHGGISAI
ncbi:orotate phosphoribosyltransferase [Alphaproteobacteria bacterium HT1-32]|nr:orotate phosphoribosyltransferase [Alphaproteobacteria bacterium HT1-32]|tara:strand:+ start:7587 stop:8240 length:654 start_codon:yes stop_codon:yes gene_type:complete